MEKKTRNVLLGAGALFIVLRGLSGCSPIHVTQEYDTPVPTPTVTVTKTKTKTVTKQKPLPRECSDLDDYLDRLSKASLEVGEHSGALEDGGDNLLTAMSQGDRRKIVEVTEHYHSVYSEMATSLNDLQTQVGLLKGRMAACKRELR